MRTSTLSLALIGSLALAACSGASVATWPNRAALDVNPLYVYAEQSLLAQHLTNLQIGGHFSSGALATALESAKRSALRASQDAQASMQAGWGGTFVPGEDDTSGHVVLLPTGLFFSPDFFIAPGADVHVYLTTAVDPRDVTFPDDSALDLGTLPTPFGTQVVSIPEYTDTTGKLRTVVLYDTVLKRLVSFAQLAAGQ